MPTSNNKYFPSTSADDLNSLLMQCTEEQILLFEKKLEEFIKALTENTKALQELSVRLTHNILSVEAKHANQLPNDTKKLDGLLE